MSHSDPSIAAIVVSHESAASIDDCLQRLRACDGVAQIRVVDNASRDGTLAVVQRHALADPRLRFVANPDNPGFSVACNAGAADADAPWLAFVNPDCLLEPDTLARLHAHALALSGDALLGADLVDEQGVRDGAARRREPDFAAMLSTAAARDLSLPADDTRTLQHVDAVSGALMLLPRSLFERLGGFDTGYRLHAEDLDLCRRAREAGATVAVANDVRVLHLRGVSSRARPLFVEWHKHRGLWRYFRKFEAPRRSLGTRAAVLVAIAARFKLAALRALLQHIRPPASGNDT
ncbi:glycosyltransferase family 2 protein [soil metagenome]